MRLQKHPTKKGTNYFKWEIILPPDAVEAAGLKESDELEAVDIKKGEMRLRKR